MKSSFAKNDKRHFKKKKIVKKAGFVHFQGIASSRFTAEADKRPCCLWTEADKFILAISVRCIQVRWQGYFHFEKTC